MPRLPRIQIPNGVFHVTSRGNRRQKVFLDANDHLIFLYLLDELSRRRGWRGYSYCLMPNHYHLVFETPGPDLSDGMQWLNGRFAQAFNGLHGLDGHVFQGRFHSVLVESDMHLLELSRYLALNPVRAGLCDRPGDWPWSSYSAVAGLDRARPFLSPRRVLRHFGRTRSAARRSFEAFVEDAPPRLAA
jgi:REP element-mobilizing transposase RayT